ncbi:hypothetical protein GQ600_10536 [Phytophthora cactorum]|nr:hypothetical protein GQ600_10536 [Phytophthora cactorum]
MIPSVKLAASIKCGLVLAVIAASGSTFADTDPAELIPVNWSPNTPPPSVVVVLNKTTTQTDSDDCLESNGTRVLVHDIEKRFCVHGWPICTVDNHQGLCPQAQNDLPNGAQCALLSTNTSNYGCLEKVNATTQQPAISVPQRPKLTVTAVGGDSLHTWAMNLPASPKEAFGELPQLLLERSENDDDFGDSNPNSGKLNTPNYVREAVASSVSRWQWKFWKKSSPSSPKQQRHKQRKHPLPGKILAPLPVSSSPGRHNVENSTKHHSLPIEPRSAESNCIGSPLPPLEQQILQRPRLVLGINGTPTVAMEQIVRLQEYNEPNPPVNALQLASIPKKCLGGDEIALMPCHSLQHRGYELLSAELWCEPVRDRNKNWLHDELPTLVKNTLHAIPWSMTKAPGPSNRGKWARFENYKLHIPLNSTTTILRVFLRAQGVLISRSYCLVSVFGEGIYGRLYGAGLTGKDKKRCLRVEAYEPATSRTYSLIVTLQDIELIFRVGGDDPEREALLAPGKKQELLRQLIALLYFEYPDESNNGDDSFAIQVLKISPEIQLNESTLRARARGTMRQDEAQRLEELAAILGKPRRARHRVLCQTIKLRGRHFYVSIYHFPAQARNLIITAYNPSSSITYRLTIGLLEAASLVKLYPYPRSGFSPEQTMLVAQGLLPRLQILGREDSRPNARMILAINGGRKGPGMTALPRLLQL